MQKKGSKRVVLYTKDIEIITGKSDRTARRMMQRIKIYYEKQPRSFITIREFSEYMDLDVDWVREKLDEAWNISGGE